MLNIQTNCSRIFGGKTTRAYCLLWAGVVGFVLVLVHVSHRRCCLCLFFLCWVWHSADKRQHSILIALCKCIAKAEFLSLQSTSNEHLYCVLCSEVLSYCCAKVLIVPADEKMSDSDMEQRLKFNVSVRHRYGNIISDSCYVLCCKYSKILILFKGQ